MSRMQLSIIAQFQDRASRGMRTLLRLQQQHERMQKAYGRSTQAAARAQQRLANASRTASGAMRREATASQRLRAALARADAMIARQVGLRERLRRAGSLAREGAGRIGRAGAMAAGIYGSVQAAAASAASLVVAPAAQVEKYQLILETVLGSAQKAKKALSWVTTFAVKTPYELEQVMEAFVQLNSYGLDPTNGLLKTLGDTAAAMGKPLMQAVEAIADAVTGENERLKEFGIKARAQGKYFYYEYTENGVTKVAKALKSNRAQIQQVLSDIFNRKYAGAMEKLSRSWEGMMSNMADMWFKFRLMVAHSGVFEFLKEKLRYVLDIFNRLEASGKLQQVAQQIGASIISGLKAVWQFGLGVWAVLQKVGAALSWAADKLGGWNNLAMVLLALPLTNLFLSAASGVIMLGRALMLVAASPLGLLVAGLAAAAAYLVDWPAVIAAARAAWARLQAALGNIDIAAVLSRLRTALAGFIDWLTGWARTYVAGVASTMNWLGPVADRLRNAWASLAHAGQRLAAAFGALGGGSGLQRLASVLGRLVGLGLGALAWWLEHVARGIELVATGIAAVVHGGAAFIAWLTALPARIAAAWQAFRQWLAQPFDPFPNLRQRVQGIITMLAALPQQAMQALSRITAAIRAFDIGTLINPVNWPGLLQRGLLAALQMVRSAFAGLDMSDAGARIMRSLWEGMKRVAAGLLEWARGLASRIESAFSAAVSWTKNLAAKAGRAVSSVFGGATKSPAAQPQARAAGGPFGRGPLLVGEHGPELIYASRAGWVAHNDNLQRIQVLAQRAAAALAGMGLAGQLMMGSTLPALAAAQPEPVGPSPQALAASASRAGAPAGGSRQQTVQVHYAPQITVHGNADPAQIRQALDAHLDDLLDRLQRRQQEQARLEF